MNYSNGQCCGGDAGLAGTTNYCGCGSQYPIVPGFNPALQTWNGQNFVVADGSYQLPIYLPNLQQYDPTQVSNVIGMSATGQLVRFADIQYAPNNALVTATGSTTPRTLANRFADVVNVLDWGADPTGTNDSAPAIQAAINYAIAYGPKSIITGTPNGKVFIPAGSYKINTPLNFGSTTFPTSNGIWLQGAGRSTVILATNSTAAIYMWTSGPSATISDLFVANNGGGTGIYVVGNGQLLNNLWLNASIGIKVESTLTVETADVQISNVIADTCNVSGLDLFNNNGTTAGPFNISISNYTSSGGGAGFTNSYGIRISQNVFSVEMTNIICSNQSVYGIALLNVSGGYAQRDINITNFVCQSYSGIPSTAGVFNHCGIFVQAGQVNLSNGKINGYPSSGVYITGGANIKLNNVNIFGNVTSSSGNPYDIYCEAGSSLKVSNCSITGGLQVDPSGNITGTGNEYSLIRFTDNGGTGSFEVIDSTLSNANGNALYVDGGNAGFIRIESNKVVNGNQGSVIPIYCPAIYGYGYIQNNYIYQANGTPNTYAISVACGLACTNNTYRYGAFQNTGISQPYLDDSNYTLTTPVPISHTVPIITVVGTAVPICTINIATSLECVYLTATIATLVQGVGPQVLRGGWIVSNNGTAIVQSANSNDTISTPNSNLAFSWVAGTTAQRAVLKVTQTGGTVSQIYVSVSVNRGESGTYLIQGAA